MVLSGRTVCAAVSMLVWQLEKVRKYYTRRFRRQECDIDIASTCEIVNGRASGFAYFGAAFRLLFVVL
jgi:hypothetical protein